MFLFFSFALLSISASGGTLKKESIGKREVLQEVNKEQKQKNSSIYVFFPFTGLICCIACACCCSKKKVSGESNSDKIDEEKQMRCKSSDSISIDSDNRFDNTYATLAYDTQTCDTSINGGKYCSIPDNELNKDQRSELTRDTTEYQRSELTREPTENQVSEFTRDPTENQLQDISESGSSYT